MSYTQDFSKKFLHRCLNSICFAAFYSILLYSILFYAIQVGPDRCVHNVTSLQSLAVAEKVSTYREG